MSCAAKRSLTTDFFTDRVRGENIRHDKRDKEVAMTGKRVVAALLLLLMISGSGFASTAGAQPIAAALRQSPPSRRTARPEESDGATPPRVSYLNGEVSFWRQGASDWAPAQLNTPLAPGDVLYTGQGGAVEIQIGRAAFVRA